MSLFLVVLNGPRVGVKLTVREGLTIGRKTGDLILYDDPKVSGIHAKIVSDNKDQLILKDQESSNGLFIDGRKVRKVAMMPGVTFQIGNTRFRVIKDEGAPKPMPAAPEEAPTQSSTKSAEPTLLVLPSIEPKVEKPLVPDSAPATPPPEPPKPWRIELVTMIEKEFPLVLPAALTEPPAIGAFSPAVILDFVEGLQADSKITLGYGPREAGFNHLDVELLDPWSPRRAFVLSPGPGSVQIKDLTNGKVLINNRPFDTAFLEENDVVSVGKTKIKIRYL